MKILVINPGSTSTKISLFVNEKHCFERSVFHDAPVLLQFPHVNGQVPFRYQVILDILKEEGAFSRERKAKFQKRPGPEGFVDDARVLIHCYSGSLEMARQYVQLGATISICGPVTFKNNRRTAEVAKEIPIEFLTVETDSPYLAPEPKRGRPNMSPYVQYVARRVAVLKGMDYEDVARITCENAMRFYGISE